MLVSSQRRVVSSPSTTDDAGFTLIELLVVMIVIGILAAIAIPLFVSQRAKAHDASTKADVSHLAKEIATYFVDGSGTLALDFTAVPGSVVVADGAGFSTTVNLTNGTARPATGAFNNLNSPSAWCVSLTDADGSVNDFKYTAQAGLGTGTC